MKIKFLTLITLVTSLNTTYANCNPNIIDESKIQKLSSNATSVDLFQAFGAGCLSGMTVMTYQYKSKDGKAVWFWLENNPKAFDKLQESIAKKEPFEVPVRFATKSLEDGSYQVIYPVNEINTDANDLIYKTYFSQSD